MLESFERITPTLSSGSMLGTYPTLEQAGLLQFQKVMGASSNSPWCRTENLERAEGVAMKAPRSGVEWRGVEVSGQGQRVWGS